MFYISILSYIEFLKTKEVLNTRFKCNQHFSKILAQADIFRRIHAGGDALPE